MLRRFAFLTSGFVMVTGWLAACSDEGPGSPDDSGTSQVLLRRLEIGVTTYAAVTPRTRVLYDNVDFHAD